jgi:hypothetical protein
MIQTELLSPRLLLEYLSYENDPEFWFPAFALALATNVTTDQLAYASTKATRDTVLKVEPLSPENERKLGHISRANNSSITWAVDNEYRAPTIIKTARVSESRTRLLELTRHVYDRFIPQTDKPNLDNKPIEDFWILNDTLASSRRLIRLLQNNQTESQFSTISRISFVLQTLNS